MGAAYRTHVASGVADGGATTYDSPSLTTVSGDVLYALVVNSDYTPAEPTGVAFDPTGVNEAFTKVGNEQTYGTYYGCSLWRLVNPTAKSAVIRATWAAGKGERLIIAVAYSGVDTTTPNGTIVPVVNATGTTTAVTATATTTAGQLVAAFAALGSSGGQYRFDSPSGTERVEASTSGAPYDTAAAQDQTASGSSTSPAWTQANSSAAPAAPWAIFVVPLNDAAGGTTYNDTLSEAVTLAESVASAHVMPATITESLTPGDLLSGGLLLNDGLTEGITLGSDYAAAAVRDLALNEGLTLGADFATAQTFVDAFGEGVTLGDGLAAGLLLEAALAETATLGDDFVSTVTKDEALTESVTLGDSFAATLNTAGVVSEGITLTDEIVAAAVYPATLSEGVTLDATLVDEHIQGGVYNDTLEEALTLGDAYSTSLVAGAVLTEGLTLDASFYTPPLGQSVRSGGGGGGGRAWGWELDREVEEEMGVLLEGPPLTPATIEAVARRLDAPTESRIIGLKQPPVPAISFDAAMVRRRRIRRRLLLLL